LPLHLAQHPTRKRFTKLVRLIHQFDEHECAQRNALANTPKGFTLSAGVIGTVVDTFGSGAEFPSNSAAVDLIIAIGSGYSRLRSCNFFLRSPRLPDGTPKFEVQQLRCRAIIPLGGELITLKK